MTYHLNFSLGDDPLVSLRDDIANERRRLERSERAEIEGRLVNREAWLAGHAESRRLIELYERRLADMEALEDTAA